jgi:hypothetical protein
MLEYMGARLQSGRIHFLPAVLGNQRRFAEDDALINRIRHHAK